MSRQHSTKIGLASHSRKDGSARDMMREEFPKGSPVAGAYGAKSSPMSSPEDDLFPDDKEHRGTHTSYEDEGTER